MMTKMQGIAVSPGVIIGKAFVLHVGGEMFSASERKIKDAEVPQEIARFEDALTRTRAEVLGIRKKISQQIGRESSDIFNAHLMILEDRTLIEDVIAVIKVKKVNCEFAFWTVLEKYFTAFMQINDEYLRERISDIKDIGRRVLGNLAGDKSDTVTLRENSIVIAHDLSPSDTAMLDKEKVLGFATEIGGPTSHTAILGRSMEIPAIVGLDHVTAKVHNGDTVIVDGTSGILIIDPDTLTLEEYTQREIRFTEITRELDELRDLPALTSDKHSIVLAANIEFPDEITSVISHGAEGIGLYRTEFFYMNRTDLPGEDEQYNAYRDVVEKMGGRPVTIRTIDFGGDKFLSSIDLPFETNPFLGWRAIRFCLARVDIFKIQLRAILRASAHGDIRVMFPLISSLNELRQVNQILAEAKSELKEKAVPFNAKMEVGAMIEI